MSYNDLLEEENVNAQFLCVLNPGKQISSWTLDSGSIYYADFTLGFVNDLQVDGSSYTEAASSSLNQGEWYWDNDNNRLYVRLTGNGNPNNTGFLVAIYEIYVSTYDAHWYRVPTDSSTNVVYYEPLVARTPSIKSTIRNVEFGFLPTQTTNITLNNAEHTLEDDLYSSSFNNKLVKVYHWLDELSTTNIKLVFEGEINSVSYSGTTVSFGLFNSVNEFENEFRSQSTAFYSTSDYANLNPIFEGAPIRYVWGKVDGFVPVNIDYVDDSPTTSDNRVWAVRAEGSSGNAVTATVASSPSSTTTRTYLDDVTGLQVGDSVWIDKTTDEYVFITTINAGSNYIEHAALSSGAASSGDEVKRGTIGYIDIIQQEVRYRAHYNRDWTESTDAQGVLNFTFDSGLETNLSIPNALSVADQVYCRVYGKTNSITKGGASFGSDDTEVGNLTDITVILFDFLKNFANIPESAMNLSSFDTVQASAGDAVGLAVPENSQSTFPKLKNVLTDLLKTGLIKLYKDEDFKWTVSQTAPITTTSRTIEDDKILRGSFTYKFDYKDIASDVLVKYARKERFFSETGETFSQVTASSDTAKYLHDIENTIEVKTLHIKESEAQTLANRYAFIFGDQQGELTINTKNEAFNDKIDDDLKIQRTKMPGNAYDEDTLRSRNFSIIEIDKSLRSVRIVLSDQKGIQDNSGSWS